MRSGIAESPFSRVEFTIGSVMGRLYQASEDKRICFSTDTPYLEQPFAMNAYFHRVDNAVYLCNVSEADENILALSTAEHGNMLPKTILIPGNCEYDVTEYFTQCARLNIDYLTLTAGALKYDSDSPTPDDMTLTLWASGRNIPVNGGIIPVSSFLKVYLGEDYIMIYAEKRRFVNVAFLSVKGNMTVTMKNIAGNGSLEPFTISLPYNYAGEGMADISICCEIGGFTLLS